MSTVVMNYVQNNLLVFNDEWLQRLPRGVQEVLQVHDMGSRESENCGFHWCESPNKLSRRAWYQVTYMRWIGMSHNAKLWDWLWLSGTSKIITDEGQWLKFGNGEKLIVCAAMGEFANGVVLICVCERRHRLSWSDLFQVCNLSVWSLILHVHGQNVRSVFHSPKSVEVDVHGAAYVGYK